MMWEYVDNVLMYGWALAFIAYCLFLLFKGGDAFKFYASLAIATLFLEVLK